MSQEEHKATTGPTTIAVSTAFAEALKECARDEGISVAALCDREYLPDALTAARAVLKKRLAKMQPAGA